MLFGLSILEQVIISRKRGKLLEIIYKQSLERKCVFRVVFPWNMCSLPRLQRNLGRTQRVSNAAMSLTTTGLALMSTVVRSTWRIVEEEQSKNHASIQFIILSFYRRSLSITPILERFSVAYAAKFLATLLINCYIVEVTKSLKEESGKTNVYISFCFLRSVWFK